MSVQCRCPRHGLSQELRTEQTINVLYELVVVYVGVHEEA